MVMNELTPLAGDLGAPELAIPAHEDPRFAHLSWPRMIRLTDGRIVLTYCMGRFHGAHAEKCPAVTCSDDGGRSFGPSQVLWDIRATDPYTSCGNCALGETPSGAVVLLAMGFRGDEANTIRGWRSTDGARSWSPVDTTVLSENRTGSVYGYVLQVPGRGLAVLGHFRPGSRPRNRGIWIAFSDDDGCSWSEPEIVTEEGLVEPVGIYSAGRIVGLFRDDGKETNDRYWQAVSDPEIVRWTVTPGPIACRETTATGRFRLPSPFLIEDPRDPSRLHCLQTSRHLPGGAPGSIHLWSADSRRLDWRRGPCLIRIPEDPRGEQVDHGYPWMVFLPPDEWLMVFYCGRKRGANSLWKLRFRIE